MSRPTSVSVCSAIWCACWFPLCRTSRRWPGSAARSPRADIAKSLVAGLGHEALDRGAACVADVIGYVMRAAVQAQGSEQHEIGDLGTARRVVGVGLGARDQPRGLI